jgi:hypothetical protein
VHTLCAPFGFDDPTDRGQCCLRRVVHREQGWCLAEYPPRCDVLLLFGGLDEDVLALAEQMMMATAPGLVPMVWQNVLRQFALACVVPVLCWLSASRPSQ